MIQALKDQRKRYNVIEAVLDEAHKVHPSELKLIGGM